MKIYFKLQSYISKSAANEMCMEAEIHHTGILDAAEMVKLNPYVLGNCRSLRTHFKNMANESPYKAINRIENCMGYGEYLANNNIDANKIFILKMLAKKEKDIPGFLNRLTDLRQILLEKEPAESGSIILSTIHSSKGQDYEEERRIFYVGITRAKDNLTVFKYKDKPSAFIKELKLL